MATWAEQSIKAIEEVIADHPELDRRSPEMRKLVSDAYPFGDRSMFPYKAWLKAMDSCLGPSEKKKAAQAKLLQEHMEKVGQRSLMP